MICFKVFVPDCFSSDKTWTNQFIETKNKVVEVKGLGGGGRFWRDYNHSSAKFITTNDIQNISKTSCDVRTYVDKWRSNLCFAVSQLKESWSCHLCQQSRYMDMIQCESCLHWFDWWGHFFNRPLKLVCFAHSRQKDKREITWSELGKESLLTTSLN